MANHAVGAPQELSDWLGRLGWPLRLALGTAAGFIAGLGHLPHGLPGLGVLGLVALLLIMRSAQSPGAGFLTGWLCGTGYFAATLFWIVEPFQVDAERHAWMAPFAMVALMGGLALFWGAAGAAAVWLTRDGRWRLAALVTTIAIGEMARSYVLTGFPWSLIAYIWVDTGVRGWASVIGPHGLSLATLALAASIAAAFISPRRWWAFASAAAIALAFVVIGPKLLPPPSDLTDRPVVRLVQPNAAQHEKWDPDKVFMFLDRQVEFTAAPAIAGTEPALVLWPETSIPFMLNAAPNTLQRISAASAGAPVV